jgi:hypothetical protein
MSPMSVKEALAKVLKDMRAMSPVELRAELDAHKDGEIAIALREAQQFFAAPYFFHAHVASAVNSLLHEDLTVKSFERSLECFEVFIAANDNSYALAA